MQKRNSGPQGPSTPSQGSSFRFDRRLVTGLDPEKLEEFNAAFRSCSPIRQALVKVLTKDLENAILQSESRDRLNGPNALADLSDLMGYRRGLRLAIKLLTDKDADDNP